MLYTPKETASILHISVGQLRRLTAEGTVSVSAKTSGGQQRYTIKDIQRAKMKLGIPALCPIPPAIEPVATDAPPEPIVAEPIDGGLGRTFV